MFWNLPTRRKAGSEPRWLSKGFTHSLSIFSIPCSTSDFWQISFELNESGADLQIWFNLLALSPLRLPAPFIFLSQPEKPSRKFPRVCNKSRKALPDQHYLTDQFQIHLLMWNFFCFVRACGLRRSLALWTRQALGDGFPPPQHLVPTICLACYLWPDNRTIISLHNRSHYHLEWERLAALVSISFMERRALVMWLFSCGGWVTLLSHRLQQ